MNRPRNDPFFEELKKDMDEALAELARGESVDEEEVRRGMYAEIDAVIRERANARENSK